MVNLFIVFNISETECYRLSINKSISKLFNPSNTLKQNTYGLFSQKEIITRRNMVIETTLVDDSKPEWLNIPNLLTIGRIFAIPAFLASFIFHKKSLGVFIYTLSCLTDLADGYLARKWNQTTEFGAFLDPVADKV